MPRRHWQHIRWFTHDDGRIEFDLQLNQRNAGRLQRALDLEYDALERTLGPVPGGIDADTPEANARRREVFQQVVRHLARLLEAGAEALNRERASPPHL